MAVSNTTFKCIKRILTDEGFQKTSEWQSADMVECSDGTDLETKLSALNTTFTQEINTLKKSVADGKALLAGSISSVIPTAGNASFTTLNKNMRDAFVSQYNGGVAAADGRVNTGSVNYQGGYNNGYSAGVTAADNRANPSSANYQSGYNNGITAGRANITTRYYHHATSDGAQHTHEFYIYVPAGYNYLTFSWNISSGYNVIIPITVSKNGNEPLYSTTATTSGSASNIRMTVTGASYILARATMAAISIVDMTGVLSVS